MTCEICEFAAEHAHWPMAGTHCRDCHRSWVSTSQAHCTLCHENFATNGVADLHWVKGKHTDPALVAKLVRVEESSGPVWRGAVSDQERTRLARLGSGVAIPAA